MDQVNGDCTPRGSTPLVDSVVVKLELPWSIKEGPQHRPSAVHGAAQPMSEDTLGSMNKSHVCQRCSAAFMMSSSLEVHMATFHGESLHPESAVPATLDGCGDGNSRKMSAPTHRFHLVEWEKEEGDQPSVSVVPEKWLVPKTNFCRWPQSGSARLVQRNLSPKKTWTAYPYVQSLKSSGNLEKLKNWERRFMEKMDRETTAAAETDRPRKRSRIHPSQRGTEGLSSSSGWSSPEPDYEQTPSCHPPPCHQTPSCHPSHHQTPSCHPSPHQQTPSCHPPPHHQTASCHPSPHQQTPSCNPSHHQIPSCHPSPHCQTPSRHPSPHDQTPSCHPSHCQTPSCHPSPHHQTPSCHPSPHRQTPSCHPSPHHQTPSGHPPPSRSPVVGASRCWSQHPSPLQRSTSHEPVSGTSSYSWSHPPPSEWQHVTENEQPPVDYRPYFEAVLKELDTLKAAVNQMHTEIDKLQLAVADVRAEGGEDLSVPELPQGFEFPLKTMEDLERLNKVLASEAVRKRLERFLYNLGGDSYRASVRVAGGALLAPSLQGAYNFTGSNKFGQNKFGFNKLSNICQALYNAVRERHEVDKMKVNSYIGEWLCTWRDRLAGGKKNRLGSQMPQ